MLKKIFMFSAKITGTALIVTAIGIFVGGYDNE